MKYFVALFLFYFSTESLAQSGKSVDFGLKFGANYSIITGLYEDLGVYGGFFSSVNLKNDKFSIQGELLFSNTDDIYFLELPVSLKYKLSDNFYLFSGPRFNWLINNEDKYTKEMNDPEDVYYFKKFGFGWEIGVLHPIYKNWFLEGRFNYNFTKQIDNDFYGDYYSSRVNTVRIGVGYKF